MPYRLPFDIPKTLKNRLLQNGVLATGWGQFRRSEMYREYTRRREFYYRIARESDLQYSEGKSVAAVRAALSRRGYTPTRRQAGEVHTFVFVPDIAWHRHLLPDLHELGPVTHYDYAADGFQAETLYRARAAGIEQRKAMNSRALAALREAHRQRPVDWVFVYANGLEISPQTVRQITEEFGVPVAGMCLDDKQSWTAIWAGDHHGGQVDIAPAFDLCWTSSRLACEWYLAEGAIPIYMPEAFDASVFHPTEVEQDIPISFVGAAYGFRPSVVRYLRRRGVPVQTFGANWAGSAYAPDAAAIFNRSIINLGMGGIGFAENLTNVKGRDFEIPGTGGGAYLTTFNADLAQHFHVGQEILCYQNRDELLELTRYYLDHPEEARAIARRGRERCLREHRWLHRYQHICGMLGILEPARTNE
jgi:spore maturation protein CgeB